MRRGVEVSAVALLLALFALQAVTGVMRKSATADEFAHLPAGIRAWKTLEFNLYDKTPPTGRMIQTLPALLFSPNLDLPAVPRNAWQPWVYAENFVRRNHDQFGRMLLSARLATVVLSLLICLLVWHTSRKLYGPKGALVSLAACALCPTLIAHGALVTSDAPAALAGVAFAALLLYYLDEPSFQRAALMGLGAGVAVITKFNGLIWIPVIVLSPFAVLIKGWVDGWRPLIWKVFGHAILALAVVYVVIMGGYLQLTPATNPDLRPTSRLLKPYIDQVRKAPLPVDFITGVDLQLADSEQGEFSQANYLRGQWYHGRRWSYYPIAWLVKEPIPLIIMFGAALLVIAVRGPRRKDEIALIALIGIYLAALMTSRLQIGVRYLLTVYPLVFILLGRLAGEPVLVKAGLSHSAEVKALSETPLQSRLRFGVIALALLWVLIADVRVWPDYLAYFNLAAGGKDKGRQWLLDSNLDWGQDLPELARWMKQNQVQRIDLAYFGADNPKRFGIEYDLPTPDSTNRYLAISANFVRGRKYPMLFRAEHLNKEDPMWERLRQYQKQTPIAVIGGSILVFDKEPTSP